MDDKSNVVRRRGPQKAPKYVHISVRVTEEQAKFLGRSENLSATVRSILDGYMRMEDNKSS